MAQARISMGGKNTGYIEQAGPITVLAPVPVGTVSGDVIQCDSTPLTSMIMYAQTDRDANGYAKCTIPCAHVQTISVIGKGPTDNDVAVAFGDRLYFDPAVSQINKDSTNGTAFGFALGAITTLGATAEILVGFGT